MRGKCLALLGILLGIASVGLFVAAIWVDAPDLQTRLASSGFVGMLLSIPVWAVVGFLDD